MARKSDPRKGARRLPGGGAAGKDEDAALWQRVAGTIKPLKDRNKTSLHTATKIAVPEPNTAETTKASPAAPRRAVAPGVSKQPPLASGAGPGMDKRTAARLRRGQLDIDGRIDLHGMTQEQAHGNLLDFIEYSFQAGRRCLLVITGKGIGKGGLGGVLRAQLPHWLNTPDLRPLILAFTPAQPRDGGGGAFYVYLRKRRVS